MLTQFCLKKGWPLFLVMLLSLSFTNPLFSQEAKLLSKKDYDARVEAFSIASYLLKNKVIKIDFFSVPKSPFQYIVALDNEGDIFLIKREGNRILKKKSLGSSMLYASEVPYDFSLEDISGDGVPEICILLQTLTTRGFTSDLSIYNYEGTMMIDIIKNDGVFAYPIDETDGNQEAESYHDISHTGIRANNKKFRRGCSEYRDFFKWKF